MTFGTLFLSDWRQAMYQVLLIILVITTFTATPTTLNNLVEGWWVEQEPTINSSTKTVTKKIRFSRWFFRRLAKFHRVWAIVLSIVILASFVGIVLLTMYHQSLYYLLLLPLFYSVSKLSLPYLLSHPLAPLILSVAQFFLQKRKEILAKQTLKSIEKLKATEGVNKDDQAVESEESISERGESLANNLNVPNETSKNEDQETEDETKPEINSILATINNFNIEEEYDPARRKQAEKQLAQIEEICFPNSISKELHKRLTECVKAVVSQLITEALIAEVDEQLGFKRYERTGEAKPSCKHRSGSRPRPVRTMWGTVTVRIPKLRRGAKDREWRILKRYERSLGPWLDLQIHLYTLGLSQRDLQEVLAIGFGQMLSVKAIEHLTEVVNKEKEAFLANPLKKTYAALIIDGSNIKVMCQTGRKKRNARGQARIVKTKKEKVILSVIGVLADGSYETLYFEMVDSETIKSWQSFLEKVKKKGLNTDKLELIVSDGRKGIEKAIKEVFPENVKHQRCIFHKLKNIGDNLSYEGVEIKEWFTPKEKKAVKTERAKEILADATKIYQKETVEQSREEIEVFKKKWEAVEEKAIRCFLEDVDLTLNYLRVDFRYKNRVRTTNLLERFFREFKQSSNEVGCFGSQKQAEVLFYLIVRREKAKRMTETIRS